MSSIGQANVVPACTVFFGRRFATLGPSPALEPAPWTLHTSYKPHACVHGRSTHRNQPQAAKDLAVPYLLLAASALSLAPCKSLFPGAAPAAANGHSFLQDGTVTSEGRIRQAAGVLPSAAAPDVMF